MLELHIAVRECPAERLSLQSGWSKSRPENVAADSDYQEETAGDYRYH